jgi:hypothetical protein
MKRDAGNEMRHCGWDDEALFDYLDGSLSVARNSAFQAHLTNCGRCRSDLLAYEDLGRALDDMASPEARPGFDEAVLAAVLENPVRAAARDSVPSPSWLRAGWPAAAFQGLGRPVQMVIGAAGVLGLMVLAALSLEAGNAGGWRELFGRAVSGLIRGGVAVLVDGTGQLVAAVKVSDILFNVARVFEPLLRSVSMATNAYGAEFWLFSTLLSLLAFLGAVRLATGSAVERGIGRVRLIL